MTLPLGATWRSVAVTASDAIQGSGSFATAVATCGARTWAQNVLGQVQASNRDVQSRCWDCYTSGQPCEYFVCENWLLQGGSTRYVHDCVRMHMGV
jgi:hypothetical protein